MGLPHISTITTLLAFGVPVYFVVKTVARAWIMKNFTCVPDIDVLTKPRDSPKVQGTAVICGGSFAGLFSASVLANHFERVVVIEPESWVFTPEARTSPVPPQPGREVIDGPTSIPYNVLAHKRTRVYQYDALHVFEVILTRFMRAVFTNFDQRASEARLLITPSDFGLFFGGRRNKTPMAKYQGRDHEVLFSNRRGMETFVRGMVVEKNDAKGLEGRDGAGNIEFIKGTVNTLNLDPSGKRISSISYRDADGQTVNLESSLIVDCTGNTQAGLKLVSRALQMPDLSEEIRKEYNPSMVYTSFEMALPADFYERAEKLGVRDQVTGEPINVRKHGFWISWVPAPGIDDRTFLIAHQGQDRIIVALGGWDIPVGDIMTWEDSVEFIRGIDRPTNPPEWVFGLLDILSQNQAGSFVAVVRFKSASRILYETKADVLPSNFIAHGDAVMRLNPRRGEGVTKSCLGAITLNALLHELPPLDPKFGATFFDRLAKRTGAIWDGSKWLDYGRPGTVPCKGETLSNGAFFRWFHERLEVVMEKNEDPAERFWNVLMYLAPVFDLMTPSIMYKIVKVAIYGPEAA